MLNSQPLGQMWGGDEETEAEKLRDTPRRRAMAELQLGLLGFGGLAQEQNMSNPALLGEVTSMAKANQHFSRKLGMLNLCSPTRGWWDLSVVVLYEQDLPATMAHTYPAAVTSWVPGPWSILCSRPTSTVLTAVNVCSPNEGTPARDSDVPVSAAHSSKTQNTTILF